MRFIEEIYYKRQNVSDFLIESEIDAIDNINKRLTVKLNLKGVYKREIKPNEKEGATKQYKRKAGQFIYGKQNLFKGAFGIIPSELDGFLSSKDLPSFDFKDNINSKWFYYYFSRSNFYKHLENLSNGTGSKRISPEEFLKIQINVPQSIEEQEKIASFLYNIDKKIGLLKDKKDEYVKFKQYLLQNLFPQDGKIAPKLRFKMYDDEWSIKKIGDLFDNSSSNLSIDNLKDNYGDYKLYGATGLIKHIDFYEKDKTYIAIIKDGASVGKTFICDSNSSILGTLQYLEPKESFDFEFCYYLLNRVHFEKYKVGSTIPHIYFKDYAMEKISIPKKEEQAKISKILFNLDKKIDLLDQEIEYVEEYKKGLLQKMFIWRVYLFYCCILSSEYLEIMFYIMIFFLRYVLLTLVSDLMSHIF